MTIAGSDSGGGAGILADVKTFEAHGVWGACAVVAVTAQNTVGVQAVEALSPELVREQIRSVATDIGVDAAKTGMLASAALVRAVAGAVREHGVAPLVVDPVLVSKHGDPLLAPDAVDAVRTELLPLATVVTPNLPEAARLAGWDPAGPGITDRDGMVAAAAAIATCGPAVVLVKGGHLPDPEGSPDLLWSAGTARWLEGPRLAARHTHGSGCVLSAAICAELARGMDPVDACVAGKKFVERAIAAGVPLGSGVGPVNPGWERLLAG